MTLLQVTAACTQCKGQGYGYGVSRYNCKEGAPFLESHERNKSLAADEGGMGIQKEQTMLGHCGRQKNGPRVSTPQSRGPVSILYTQQRDFPDGIKDEDLKEERSPGQAGRCNHKDP